MAFDTDYQAVLTKTTNLGGDLPATWQQDIDNQTVLDLKSDNIWDEIDIFYSSFNNGSSIYSTINWKDPDNHQLTLSGAGITWAVDTGFTNDRTAFINTNWNPSDDGVNVTLNDASYGMKVEVASTTHTSAQCVFASRAVANDGNQVGLLQLSGLGSVLWFNNTGSQGVDTGGASALLGVVAIHRSSSAGHEFYRDGVQEDGEGDTSVGLSSNDIYLLAENNGGTTATQSNATFSFFWAGSALTTLQDEINTILNTNITDKEAGPPAGNDLINGSANITFSQSNNLTGKGELSGASTLSFSQNSDLFGIGSIVTPSQINFNQDANLLGKGLLIGSSILEFDTNVIFLLPDGLFTASANLSFTNDSILKGKGFLLGQSNLDFALSNILKGKGIVLGSATLNFDATALFLLSEGFFTASANLDFSNDALLKGKGILSGSANLDFTTNLIFVGTIVNSGCIIALFMELTPNIEIINTKLAPNIDVIYMGLTPNIINKNNRLC